MQKLNFQTDEWKGTSGFEASALTFLIQSSKISAVVGLLVLSIIALPFSPLYLVCHRKYKYDLDAHSLTQETLTTKYVIDTGGKYKNE